MSQQDLAASSGVAQSNISAIEHGRRVPTAETLQRLVEGCGFNLVARAGPRTIVVPSPDDDDDGALPPEPPTIEPDASVAERVRALVAALDAAEAIVRARR